MADDTVHPHEMDHVGVAYENGVDRGIAKLRNNMDFR
jgi:hypothetical protein